MVEQSLWQQQVSADPGHSAWYIERFRKLAAGGADLVGEARLVDAMLPRESRVLDAGCGAGRHAGWLAQAGHNVVGVDGDATLIEAAKVDHPGPDYHVADLAELTVVGITDPFDLILCAGNVMTFLAPSTRRLVLHQMAAHLKDDGRLVTGFGAGRGYPFEEFLADAQAAGLTPDLLLSTWDLRPFTPDSDFLVAVFCPKSGRNL